MLQKIMILIPFDFPKKSRFLYRSR